MLYTVAQGPAINIAKHPPTVETKEFDARVTPPQVGPDATARTHWQFECDADTDYAIEEQHHTEQKWSARIRIRSVKLGLSLPITIYLPSNASPQLKAHEEGHVEICRRIYADAGEIARQSTLPILSKTYEGDGLTLEEACAQASKVAVIELTETYGKNTTEVVNHVSTIYDFLQGNEKYTASASVDEAMKNTRIGAQDAFK
jgi:hypothetical protein